MEKINDCAMMNHKKIQLNLKKTINVYLILLFIIFLILPGDSSGQIRAGSGYLKMLHGAREVGIGGTITSALDFTYSFYANPGATGFLREWQWSATYTNWISDLYNASFLYGRKIRMPWSRWTKFALGINYLGIPEFNNADELSTPVSGNNLLITASIGQQLSFISNNLSFGTNIKYFDSELALYEANALIFDIGLLYRTPRFTFLRSAAGSEFLDHIIFSSGLALTNLGNPIKFTDEKTPLPRTFRAGIALNIGSHHGFQIGVGTDYRVVRDEDGFMTFGSELSWRQLISLRLGYSWEDNLLGHFIFGASIRFDDQIINNMIFGRNNALRLDFAANQNNDFFASPYHGSVTYQPIGPEKFRLIAPPNNAIVNSDSVTLTWELTREPDLYDDVGYWLLVDQDSTKLVKVLTIAKRDKNSLFLSLKKGPFLVSQPTDQTHFLMDNLQSGDYFWTVLAYDIDRHVRFAEMKHRPIAKFHVTAPDPRIIAINFAYDPWITQDDYQGTLTLKINNFGERTARNFSLSIYDSTLKQANHQKEPASVAKVKKLISQQTLPPIKPGEEITVDLEWRTRYHGLHQVSADIFQAKHEDEVANTTCTAFYTIPKGIFTTRDTVCVQTHFYIIYDLPYVGKIFFDSSSTEVNEKYITEWIIDPPLAIFAKRLQENPSITISLQGTIDPNSNEDDIALANERTKAVHDTLLNLGVSMEQMEIKAGKVLPSRRMPGKPEDARWILEERRRVDITTDQSSEETLFKPLQTTYIEKIDSSIKFDVNIVGVVPIREGVVHLESDGLKDSLDINNLISGAKLVNTINWRLNQKKDEKEINNWLKKNTIYTLVLIDTLNRRFKVRPQKTYLETRIIGRERRYFVLAEFATTAAFYNFYWTSLLDVIPFLLENPNTRIRFSGHGCATGSEVINDRLSKKRANDFKRNFLQDVKKRYPELYEQITQRFDPSQGFGESQSFEIKSSESKIILIGDNNTPLGRQLNRRVMIFFHTLQ